MIKWVNLFGAHTSILKSVPAAVAPAVVVFVITRPFSKKMWVRLLRLDCHWGVHSAVVWLKEKVILHFILEVHIEHCLFV